MEVWRRVEASAIATGTQDRLDHRSGRAFAFRAGDDDAGPAQMRLPELTQQPTHPVMIEARMLPARRHTVLIIDKAVEIVERRLIPGVRPARPFRHGRLPINRYWRSA